jgi:hypothetical protein
MRPSIPTVIEGRKGRLRRRGADAPSRIPSLAGYIFERLSMDAPFARGAFLQGVNAFLFMVFFRDIKPPEEEPTTESDEKVTQHRISR